MSDRAEVLAKWLHRERPTANTRGSTVRTDFIDYPTGWEIQREIGMKLEHDPRCSSVPQADVPRAEVLTRCTYSNREVR